MSHGKSKHSSSQLHSPRSPSSPTEKKRPKSKRSKREREKLERSEPATLIVDAAISETHEQAINITDSHEMEEATPHKEETYAENIKATHTTVAEEDSCTHSPKSKLQKETHSKKKHKKHPPSTLIVPSEDPEISQYLCCFSLANIV